MSRPTRRAVKKAIPVNPLQFALDEARETIQKFKDGIDTRIDSHAPRVDDASRLHVRPGWSDSQITFYCERCRTTWPCRTVNDLRALYGEVLGWEPATRAYEPLTLRLAEKPATTPSTNGENT